MPIVPQTGQLSVSNLKATANDSITRNVTTNVSLKDLRNIIIADGQPSPTLQNTGDSNISMSSFRGSQIMGILIQAFQENASTYSNLNDGSIDVTIAASKFSTSNIKVELTGPSTSTILINSSNPFAEFQSLNADSYTIKVTDEGTGRSFTQTNIVVTYNSGTNTYRKNY